MRHHPKSPIQPGGSILWAFLLFGFAMVGIWGWQQYDQIAAQFAPQPKESTAEVPPSDQSNGPQQTTPNLLSLFSNDDYPAEAIRNGEQGTVGVRVTVGANGTVTDCSITQSSGSDALDRTTCKIFRERLKMPSTTTADGLSKIIIINQKVRWVLPSE